MCEYQIGDLIEIVHMQYKGSNFPGRTARVVYVTDDFVTVKIEGFLGCPLLYLDEITLK